MFLLSTCCSFTKGKEERFEEGVLVDIVCNIPTDFILLIRNFLFDLEVNVLVLNEF